MNRVIAVFVLAEALERLSADTSVDGVLLHDSVTQLRDAIADGPLFLSETIIQSKIHEAIERGESLCLDDPPDAAQLEMFLMEALFGKQKDQSK
jgi:hypothetical protein